MCACKCGHGWVGVGARVHTGMSVVWVDVGAGTHDVCRCVQRDCSSGSLVGGWETPSRLWPSCPGLQTLLGSLFAAQGLEQMDVGVPRCRDGWVQGVPRGWGRWVRAVPRGQDGWAPGCPGAGMDGHRYAQGPGQMGTGVPRGQGGAGPQASPRCTASALPRRPHTPEALSPACSNRLYHRYFWVGLK